MMQRQGPLLCIAISLVVAVGIGSCRERSDTGEVSLASKSDRDKPQDSHTTRRRRVTNGNLTTAELIGELRRDATWAFKIAKELPKAEYDELEPEDRREIMQLCRVVVLSRDIPVDERTAFAIERLPHRELRYVFDDLIRDVDAEALRRVEALIEKQNFPVEEPENDLCCHIAHRWCELGMSEEWLGDWAASLKSPEEQAAVRRIIRHNFGRDIVPTKPNKSE